MTKPEPYRLTRDAYPVGQEITTRVSDIDGNGHLNAIRIGKFYEEARASFYKLLDHGKRHPRVLVAELKIRYLGEGFWPGTVEVRFNFRFSTASTPESLKARLIGILERNGVEHDIDWVLAGKPYLTERGVLVRAAVDAIHDVTGVQATLSTTGGTSDGRFIADICSEVVEIGPGNATIHKLNECVAVADLEPLAHIYERLLDRLELGGGGEDLEGVALGFAHGQHDLAGGLGRAAELQAPFVGRVGQGRAGGQRQGGRQRRMPQQSSLHSGTPGELT